MKDNYGREVNYLRISVTDRCNLRCKYCMPAEGVDNLGHDKILTFENIERIVQAAAELGIGKYRITGGEPLARRGIVDLIASLSKIEGVEELALTTNGTLLADKAEALKKAGLGRVNISLDTLNHTKYAKITRGGDLNSALEGINAAMKYGLTPLKINVVVMKGFNDNEILDFVQLTYQYPYQVRFIELMPIGHAYMENEYEFMSNEEVKKKLPMLKPLEGQNSASGVADVYKYPGALGTIGFISAMSNHFCGSCNKIRLTADGKLKTCLHSNQEIDLNEVLSGQDDKALKETLKMSILNKEDRHHLNEGSKPIYRDMNKIGG